MTKLIKEKINTIIHNISSKKETRQEVELPNNKRIIRSKRSGTDEYDYFNRMENL